MAIFWVLDHYPAGEEEDGFLLQLATTLSEQGFDWGQDWYNANFANCTSRDEAGIQHCPPPPPPCGGCPLPGPATSFDWGQERLETFDAAAWVPLHNGSLAFAIRPNSTNNGEAMLHDGLPSVFGTVSATLVFPVPVADPGCAGFLVGAVAGSFQPGANSFEAWEVSLSPAGFLRLGSHNDDFRLLKQVNGVAVPVGEPVLLSVQISGAEAARGIRLRISVDGKQLLDYSDHRPPWTPGPALGLRSYQAAVTYSQLTVVPQSRSQHRHHRHGLGGRGNRGAPTPRYANGVLDHGVNNGQAIKEGGVRFRLSGDSTHALSSHTRVQLLDKYHGAASGIFSCDEHLAGLHPSHGTELCAVVEAMWSYETLFSIQGDAVFAERAERLAYNALPATLTEDMWAHQCTWFGLRNPHAYFAPLQECARSNPRNEGPVRPHLLT